MDSFEHQVYCKSTELHLAERDLFRGRKTMPIDNEELNLKKLVDAWDDFHGIKPNKMEISGSAVLVKRNLITTKEEAQLTTLEILEDLINQANQILEQSQDSIVSKSQLIELQNVSSEISRVSEEALVEMD